MKTLKISTWLILLILIAKESRGQLRPFQNDFTISDNKGIPTSDKIFYWPVNLFGDSSHRYPLSSIDTFAVRHYSDFLSALNEPILSNSYLGKDVIRFTWLRSFHQKVVIRLERSADKIIIYQKKIKDIKPIEIEKDHYKLPTYNEVKLTYVVNSADRFEESNWSYLLRLMEDSGYLKMRTDIPNNGFDGADWIIEMQTKDGWYVVKRWAPDKKTEKEFRSIADYLLDNSKFKKEERY